MTLSWERLGSVDGVAAARTEPASDSRLSTAARRSTAGEGCGLEANLRRRRTVTLLASGAECAASAAVAAAPAAVIVAAASRSSCTAAVVPSGPELSICSAGASSIGLGARGDSAGSCTSAAGGSGASVGVGTPSTFCRFADCTSPRPMSTSWLRGSWASCTRAGRPLIRDLPRFKPMQLDRRPGAAVLRKEIR